MRSSRDHQRKAEMAAIRGLLHLKAEAMAAKAAAYLQSKNVALTECEEKRTQREEGWRRTLEEPFFSIDLARFWFQAFHNEVRNVAIAQAGVDAAGQEVQRRTEELCAAAEREDMAKDLAGRARKKFDLQRDETRMAQALDRHALRESRS